MATILERVKKVTIAQLGVTENEVSINSNFSTDLGADSLDQVELLMALEEEFGTPDKKITIPDEEGEKILTVEDAVDFLKSIGVSDFQAPPRPPERSGFPRINLPRPNLNRPQVNRPNPQVQQQNKPVAGNPPRGGQPQRRDNRPRRDRPQGNMPRPNNMPRPQAAPPQQPSQPFQSPPQPPRNPEPPSAPGV